MMLAREPITLATLLPESSLEGLEQYSVSGMTLDSRQIQTGDLFVAIKGHAVDGRHYIDDALARGASAIFMEADDDREALALRSEIPVVILPRLALQLSAIAGRFYSHPSRAMTLVGVTGTNGKTTCALLLAQMFALLQQRAGVLGTLGYGVLKADRPMSEQLPALVHTGLTTPDAIGVQKILRELADAGATCASMEVSSHSLVQDRVADIEIGTALFTNLSQDHLDYHGNMDAYGKAKARLLQQPGLRRILVNHDDAWCAGLLAQKPESVTGLSYSLSDTDADVHLTDRFEQRSGISAHLVSPWGSGELHTPLLGDFNLSNLLGVIGVACAHGFALEAVLRVVPELVAAPGRMEAVVVDEHQQDVQVVVDYAHTPDALENTLKALQSHNTGRLWCVFGCGGDRDTEKRPLMGRLAERYSDYVIVTNDNPRTEDPAQIAADILRGMDNDHQCLVIADRAQAIDLAVQQARSGDTILVAGKGHEDYQIFAHETLTFSDRAQVRQSLDRRLKKRASGEVAS